MVLNMKIDREELVGGIKDWLTETVLHGPKYLVGTRIWTKLIWGAILLGFFIYAMTILAGSAQDWKDNPVVTSIDTVEAPTSGIPFPSITACKKMPRYHESWELPEMIFNFFQLSNCSSDCNKHQAAKMVGVLDKFIGNTLDNYIEKTPNKYHLFLLMPPYKGLGVGALFSQGYCALGIKLKELWAANPDFLAELKAQWQTALLTLQPFSIEVLMDKYNISIDFSAIKVQDIIDQSALLKSGKPKPRNNGDVVDVDVTYFKECEANDEVLWHFLAQVYRFNQNTFYANFGSTLRVLLGAGKLNVIPYMYEWNRDLSDGMAVTKVMQQAAYDDKIFTGCLKATKEDRLFHGMMKEVGKMFNSKVSIFDIPKLFNPNLPPRKHDNTLRPSFSLCEINQFLNRHEVFIQSGQYEECYFIWMDAINSYSEIKKNPYHMKNAKNCTTDLSNAIGIDTKNLMVIMKIAYLYADVQDVENLYNQVKKAGLMVPLKTFDEIRSSLQLSKPLAISNYLKHVDPTYKLQASSYVKDWTPIYTAIDNGTVGSKHAHSFHPTITTEFRPTITDYGLCSSFNSMMEVNVFDENSVGNFHEVFHHGVSKNVTLKMGGEREYIFILDTRERMNYPFNATESTHIATISINHPEEFYNVIQDNVYVEAGTEMIVRIQPIELVSDEDVVTVPLEKRKCRMKFEVPESMPLFQEYSRKACLFNCMFDFSLQECQCYPWNFPKPIGFGAELPMCTFYGNECFFKKFQNDSYMTSQCDCLPACNSITYKYQIDKIRKFTSDEIYQYCQVSHPHHEYVKYTEKNYRGLKNIGDPNLANDFLYLYEKTRCKQYLKAEYAIIKVRLEGSSYLRRVQSVRYKTFDKISIVGGTLGLFSGFSIIFVFEVIYWFLVTIKKAIKFPRKKINGQPSKVANTEIEWKTSQLVDRIVELENMFAEFQGRGKEKQPTQVQENPIKVEANTQTPVVIDIE